MTDKLELKSSHEVVDTVDVADVESIFYCKPTDPDILTVLMKDGKRLYCDEVCPVDSLQEETKSEDLEEAAKNHAAERFRVTRDRELGEKCKWSFKAGAEWQKKHLWKDAQGDDLPEYEREVIVLSENGYVAFGHRPNPDGWDGRSIGTNEVTHYTPKLYDKGGWNQPNVKWWLDIEKLPNMEE